VFAVLMTLAGPSVAAPTAREDKILIIGNVSGRIEAALGIAPR
jgi:hypothetical protein